MFRHERLRHELIAGIEAALGPYRWKGITVRAVAFRLVEAIEGDVVAAGDSRVWIVERATAGCGSWSGRWRRVGGAA
jgi:hypothetical protein